MTRRLAALGAAIAILGGACGPAPAPSATIPAASNLPTPDGSGAQPTPIATGPGAVPALAGAVRDAIDPARILADLRQLETITVGNGGTRAAGSAGYDAAAAFVAAELEAAGLVVTRHEIELPLFIQVGPGAIELQSPRAPIFEGVEDFKPMLFSPSGDVTAAVVAVGFDPAAEPGSAAGLGCEAVDWADYEAGTIALVQPGPCRARQVVEHAQRAGAVAIVRSYPDWTSGRVLRPTLLDPDGLSIPVVGATHQVGLALNEAAADGLDVRVAVEARTEMRTAASVIGETAGGDPGRVVMLGGHLDSVVDGPGINDNGSGTMTVLEIARRLAQAVAAAGGPSWKVRVAFWTGEEIGLWGSSQWFNALAPDDRVAIAAYLNLDMVGSPNGVREIYQWSAEGNAGAAALETLFVQAFDLEGLSSELVAAGGSDDLPFVEAGIPTSGLFSGHNVPKSEAQAAAFGGTVGDFLDPCYHLPCDTTDNVDPELLGQMARATGWVAGYLASGTAALP